MINRRILLKALGITAGLAATHSTLEVASLAQAPPTPAPPPRDALAVLCRESLRAE